MSSVIMEIVLHGHVEEQSDMAVGDPVEDLTTLFAGPHQTGEPKLAELMAGARLGRLCQQGEVADTKLAPCDQGIDNAHPPWIGQQLEPFSDDLRRVEVEKIVGKGAVLVHYRPTLFAHDETLARNI